MMAQWRLYSNRAVQWFDGKDTFTGRVISTGDYPRVEVRRSDGEVCKVHADLLRPDRTTVR